MSDRSQPKSQWTQLGLALLFGPLGVIYSSLSGGVVLALAAAVLVKDFGVHGLFIAWGLSIAAGYLAVRHWNHRAASSPKHDGAPRTSLEPGARISPAKR